MASVTINTTDTQHVFKATPMDASGVPVSGLSGYGYTWSPDDNGTLCTIGQNVDSATMHLTGLAGTVNLKCTATKGGSPTLTGTIQVVIQGQVADHLDIAMTS